LKKSSEVKETFEKYLVNIGLPFTYAISNAAPWTMVENRKKFIKNNFAELENYFSNIEIPTQPVKLNTCSTIKDCSLFIKSQFSTVKANNGNSTFLPYLSRLQELKRVLTTDHLLFGK
jgi:hypothetical protein